MTIPYNKNITKQPNNYSYVIAIILQGLLQWDDDNDQNGIGLNWKYKYQNETSL